MIKILSQNLINQIAAGEVIERPSSVIKELIENSIDAGATNIEIIVVDAGKSLISIKDNGCGMDKNSMELCVCSHATSKLSSENLTEINTFGFRGEALPSISSIARISIISSEAENNGWEMICENSKQLALQPKSHQKGTTVEVRDLFFATPARLKFLKTNLAEFENCKKIIDIIAIAHENISFTLYDSNKEKFAYQKTNSIKKRVEDVCGKSFVENIFEINHQQNDMKLKGFIGAPTFNKSSTNSQFFFINNRFVKDKILSFALKLAYSGLVPQGRFPACILFLEIPYCEVDVNAHPAKIEIRFKDTEKIRMFLMNAIKNSLKSFVGNQVTNESSNFFLEKYQNNTIKTAITHENNSQTFNNKQYTNIHKSYEEKLKIFDPKTALTIEKIKKNVEISQKDVDLGTPIIQINNTYIISITDENEVIFIDQHAAAERITLEDFQKNEQLVAQNLLLPEIFNFSEAKIEMIEQNKEFLNKLGLYYEKLSADMIVINAIPAILNSTNIKSLINDIVDELENFGATYSINEKIHKIISTIACHSSLRAGTKLSEIEMKHFVKSMGNIQNIAQCCHGRPSFVKFSLKDLNLFFERT